ncbi:putative bifunctional diguanylate cyclase/phosphodiesterase [Methylopila turkensis]|uniref:EAL domain-containing protein n=1 Tax=Methylopila turkensis TaxID=1437816 RepID=A0A9W6JNX6_9HYPH|nr:EAL domain-containing protein [Methylopila turkensis]GLK79698.1 hypothetical protein GCM10008174_14390 [Methylopila turkensis]
MNRVPEREAERLTALRAAHIVGTPTDQAFDAIADIAQRVCGTAIAFVSLLDEKDAWLHARRGVDEVSCPREQALCATTILADDLLVVEDAAHDERFARLPIVAERGFRFYAGAPILARPGVAYGAVCVMDVEPRLLSAEEARTLTDLATLAVRLIDERRRRRETADAHRALDEQTRELALRARRFEQTERLAHVGGWTFDLDTNIGELSEETSRITGFPGGGDVHWDDILLLLTPEDRQRLDADRRRIVEERRSVSSEYRIRTPAGEEKWVYVIGDLECVDGAPRRLFGIAQDVSERRREADLLERAAQTDFMTGLANRARLNAVAEELLARDGRPFGLLLLDLDRLKTVNDTLGHARGDALIRTAASRLAAAVDGEGMAFRCGGDEFAAVLYDCPNAAALRGAARRLARAINVPFEVDAQTIVPAVTIGGALSGVDGSDLETLTQNADFALFEAKDNNRGGYVKFKPGLRTTITQRITMVRDLDAALTERRIVPHYQPIVDLATAQISSLEALARVRTPKGRLLSAADIAPALADPKVAYQLTSAMIAMVTSDIAAWDAAGVDCSRVAVNVSMADFRKGDLEARLSAATARHGLPLSRLTLEVTETVLLDGADANVPRMVRRLRERGVRVALDDFGTGFASLSHLRTLPVDVIKIDRSFTRAMETDRPSRAIVQALIDLALKLNVKIVAEGVETPEQADMLQTLGCHFAQGYLFARPACADDTRRMMALFSRSGPSAGVGFERWKAVRS